MCAIYRVLLYHKVYKGCVLYYTMEKLKYNKRRRQWEYWFVDKNEEVLLEVLGERATLAEILKEVKKWNKKQK